MDNDQNTRISFSRIPKFESGQTQEIVLDLSSYSFDQNGGLPREAMIILTTQYGTLRETKVLIPLTIGFDWQ